MRESDKKMENIQHKKVNNISDNILSNFLINGIDYRIIGESNSKIEGEKLGLTVKDPVPVYYLEGTGIRKGSYHSKENYILIFSNADEETLKHEIIHSIEYKQVPSGELEKFYILVKKCVTEDSFEHGVASFNFQKNIHEFIADGYSKNIFIDALKKENLYEEFLEKTSYLFE